MLNLVVERVRELTPDIKSFTLVDARGGAVPDYDPGAHIRVAVVLPGGHAGIRSYSLIEPSNGRSYEIAVLRDPHGSGGSLYMHGLRADDPLRASVPQNEFAMDLQAAQSVLIAGGIGITPLLCMARYLRENDQNPRFFYVARSPELMAYRDEARALGAQLVFDDGSPARGLDLAQALGPCEPGKRAYVCGPRGLVAAVLASARDAGWPAGSVRYELFTGAMIEIGDRPFEVVTAQSGKIIHVGAEESILDALIAAGLDPLFDCRRGDCGVCATPVLEGLPDHRDHNLSEHDRTSGAIICTCVSRALSQRLVLDL